MMVCGLQMIPVIENKPDKKTLSLGKYLAIPVIGVIFILSFTLPTIISDRLYEDYCFYLLYLLFWAWWGIIALSIRLFSRRLKRNTNDKLANIILITMAIIIGIPGSVVLGDIYFKKGGMFFGLYMSIPSIFAIVMLSYSIIKPKSET
jgi:hypothetical protein